MDFFGRGKTSHSDSRYAVGVAGLSRSALRQKLEEGIAAVIRLFPPRTGVCVFVFDFGKGGGLGYISNSERADMIAALKEWIHKEEFKS